MIEVEIVNRSGSEVDEAAAVELARSVLAGEGVGAGELGLAFVGPDESRALKREHLGIDEATDALAFPIDGLGELPDGMPRQLGDVVVCPGGRGGRVAPAARARAAAPRRLRPRARDGSTRGGVFRMSVTPLPRDPEDEQRERSPRRSPPPAPGRAPSLIDSFNYAFEGIIHVLRTQRNLRIHFLAAVLVFGAAIAVGVTRLQLIALVLAIAFVLVAEMLNTAIEGIIDVSTTSFDPNAKLAKDIAAGAVLIASITAIAIGFLVFQSAVGERATNTLNRVRDAPADITLVALVLVVLIVIATKAWTGRGTPLRGGLPSGHAAVAFAGWVAITYLVGDNHRFVVSALTLIMAVLVAQTRVESGIHSSLEVAYGGALGAIVTLVVFQLIG